MDGQIYFEIQADDTGRATKFYKEVFGWKFDKIDGLPVEYWSITTRGTRSGLLQRPAQTPPPGCGDKCIRVLN